LTCGLSKDISEADPLGYSLGVELNDEKVTVSPAVYYKVADSV